jgi:hypothetical protein
MKRAILALTVLLLSAPIARDQQTEQPANLNGKALFIACSGPDKSANYFICLSYLKGVRETLETLRITCHPDGLPTVEAFRSYLKSDAADLNDSAAQIAIDYFEKLNNGCSPP